MRTVAVPDRVMPGNQKWGLTMRVITDDSYKRLPKNTYGWSGAYGTHFWVDPDNKITAVYMKNSSYDGGSGALTAARFEEDVYL
jgi:CubicO group peptidase (beta-lactamase class C family)